jgi:hypothetical protein
VITELNQASERVHYWKIAAARCEWAWIRYEGPNPWEKERLRRAYEFADRVLLGWERRLELARAKSQGLPLLRLVPRSA